MNREASINRIENLRAQRKFTQEEVAENIGTYQSSYNRIINHNEEKFFTFEQMLKLAEFYDVSIDYLLCREKQSENNTEAINTLADIENCIFKLRENNTGFSLEEDSSGDIVIKLSEDTIQDFLRKYQQILKYQSMESDSNEVYTTWKEVELKKSESRYIECDYKSRIEYGKEKTESFMNDVTCDYYGHSLYNKLDIDCIKEYLNTCVHDVACDCYDISTVMEYVKEWESWYNEGELPFK